MLPLMPPYGGEKFNFVHDFANNAGYKPKTKKASLGLSAIAELLVTFQLLKLLVCVIQTPLN